MVPAITGYPGCVTISRRPARSSNAAVREIETDYLVVGAGAAGMAFVDALITDCDADVVLVHRRHRPGGQAATIRDGKAQPVWRCKKSSVCSLNPSTFS
jgi:NADPH-dependent 2,4-dienoyl-CoA reductase/sulfur reductase-like enzyme